MMGVHSLGVRSRDIPGRMWYLHLGTSILHLMTGVFPLKSPVLMSYNGDMDLTLQITTTRKCTTCFIMATSAGLQFTTAPID